MSLLPLLQLRCRCHKCSPLCYFILASGGDKELQEKLQDFRKTQKTRSLTANCLPIQLIMVPGGDAWIGVLRGGQLGRMLSLAARRMGIKVLAWTGGDRSGAASTADRLIDEPFDDERIARIYAPYKSPQSNSRIFQFPPCRKLRNVSPCIQVAESSQFANTGNERKRSFPKMALAVPISGWQTTLSLSSKVLLKSKRM